MSSGISREDSGAGGQRRYAFCNRDHPGKTAGEPGNIAEGGWGVEKCQRSDGVDGGGADAIII